MTLSNVMVLTVKAMAKAREVIALLLLMQARLDGVSRMIGWLRQSSGFKVESSVDSQSMVL